MPEERREWLSPTTNRLRRHRWKSMDEGKAENKGREYMDRRVKE
jgi:hypothetical protein